MASLTAVHCALVATCTSALACSDTAPPLVTRTRTRAFAPFFSFHSAGKGIKTNSPIPSTITKEPIVMAEVPVVDGSKRHCAIRLCSWVDGPPLVGNATLPLLVQAGCPAILTCFWTISHAFSGLLQPPPLPPHAPFNLIYEVLMMIGC